MKRSSQIFFLTLFCCFTLLLLTGDAYADDVLQTVRNKAAKFIHDLRPLIFVLAGFGLIGFAFGAIFGKISWKWFANIAIGLFLVANVGLFIDYFATKSGASGQYARDLGYGKYLDSSGAYTPTEGSNGNPQSQNTPNGANDGKTDNNSSEDLNNGCVPGTGTGCGTGTGKENGSETTGGADKTGGDGSGLPDELKNAPEMSADEIAAAMGKNGSSQTTGNETTSGLDMASAAGGIGNIYDQIINEEDPDEEALPGTGFENTNNNGMPSGEQLNSLAQKAQEQYNSTGKIDMNQLLRDEIAAGRMTEEEAAQAGYIFAQAANSKGGNVGDAINDVLDSSKKQIEEDKATAEREAEYCKAKGGYWSNNRCMEIINEEDPDEEALPGTGFENEAAACKAKGGYWSNNRCMDIINEETPDEAPLPGTGYENVYDVDGGQLGEVVVTGKDYSKEKQSCTLKGGKWNSSKLSCEYDALNSPISIPSTNQNTSDMPSDEQMNALAQRAQEQYKSTGKINMNQLLREEIAAGRMTEEQAARAGYIFTDVANSNGGNVGAAIDEVLSGSKEQMEANKTTQQSAASNSSTVSQTVPSEKTEEDEGSGISQYGCNKMGGTWDASTGSCKGVKAPVSSGDDEEDDTPSMVDEEDTPEDMGVSFYGCNKKGGKWVNGECILP